MNQLFDDRLDRVLLESSMLIGLFASIFFASLQLIQGLPINAVLANGIIGITCLSIYVSYLLRFFSLSYWLIVIFFPVLITANTIYFGNINIHLYIISLGVIATFLSRKKKYWGTVSWVIIVALFVFNYIVLYRNGRFPDLDVVGYWPFFFNAFFSMIIIFTITHFYKTIHENQRKKLEESNETKEKLISIISHDLRSPLHNVKNLIGLYNEKLLTQEDLRPLMLQISEQLDQTTFMVDNTLYWVKNQLTSSKPSFETVNLKNLINSIIAAVRIEVQNKCISVSFDCELCENSEVETDQNMLIIVLRNIVSNAIKFSHEKSGLINLILAEKGEEKISLIVKDNGVGMSEVEVSELFSNNTNSKPGTTGEEGFGIGFTLVRNYSETLSIEIDVKSELGKGTSFELTIPRKIVT